ncbi:tyrosine-type recombinase/integrase [Candidatus Pacearchaeota archaeon]|nr:tyrosine-type recombinase/integrase [Candidatus Pacearchaeota archaeon]
MEKIDPYKHKERWERWEKKTAKGIPGISKKNSEIIKQYLHDMEHGLNVSSKSVKGGRSYIRLNSLAEKMVYFSNKFHEIYSLNDITKIREEQIMLFFSRMRKGEIVRQDGKTYLSIPTFVKIFKAFWHWHQIVNRKNGVEILDITLDLDVRGEKPKWVYLTEEQIKKLCDNTKWEYKVMIMFLFDTGMRAPSELMNIRVSDLYNNFKEVNVRDEVSKTFGRRIKLMLSSELVESYVREKELKPEDYLFIIQPFSANKYLKRLAKRVFGNEMSEAGKQYKNLTMYDFRHCSCCYWLPRYKSESALKYRFGWKKSDKIHYYSELLGMKDTIQEDDMFLDTTKTEIEQKLQEVDKSKEMMEERLTAIEGRLDTFIETIDRVDIVFGRLENAQAQAIINQG